MSDDSNKNPDDKREDIQTGENEKGKKNFLKNLFGKNADEKAKTPAPPPKRPDELPPKTMGQHAKGIAFIFALSLGGLWAYNVFNAGGDPPFHSDPIKYKISDVISAARERRMDGDVEKHWDVKRGGVPYLTGHLYRKMGKDGKPGDRVPFKSYTDEDGIRALTDVGVGREIVPPEDDSSFLTSFMNSSWPSTLLIVGVLIYFFRKNSPGGSNPMNGFGGNKAKMLTEDTKTVTFADVAGCDEAKEEVAEIADFLADPQKYQKLGGKIPTGILMVGPPGTGKTLLARAIAGEASNDRGEKVPFFTISGSDFVEMFVGVGASRVRDMFTKAKEHAPCIIFIDEIDAVGRQRGGSGMPGGGNDEREQTLNQILVEMDGFNGNEGVIVIAATNRADVLDKALLRPGRFDRQVEVGLPDVKGREQILNVHIKKVPAADDVELKYIAQGTPGFSGADLANLVNEAALFAARANQKEVTMANMEKAKDKILMGAERKSMAMSPEEKERTAWHEAGHCIVGRLSPGHDPVYKVSIMPRGRALGITMFLPERDTYSANIQKLNSQIKSLTGGRIAEEILSERKGMGREDVTTGASNDIERATEIAKNMITKWDLGKKRRFRTVTTENGSPFMGQQAESAGAVSPELQAEVVAEIQEKIDTNYAAAEKILHDNVHILEEMAKALIQRETINKKQIDFLMDGGKHDDPNFPQESVVEAGWSAAVASNDNANAGTTLTKPVEVKSITYSPRQ